MSQPWLLRVLNACRDAMDAAKPGTAPATHVGWPNRSMSEGVYVPFVWFDKDPIEVVDGFENHLGAEIVTGIVFRKDPSRQPTETELQQAITAYYLMRNSLALAIENEASDFNAAFEGVMYQDSQGGGVRPSNADDFDGHSVIGERWLAQGRSAVVGAATS